MNSETLLIIVFYSAVKKTFKRKGKSEKEFLLVQTLHKKWTFPLRISSINVTKSTGNCGFGHIYWRNP